MHQDSRETSTLKKILEAQKRSDPHAADAVEEPIGPAYGPRRRAPRYYAGETYKGLRMQYPDVERNPNGSLPGIRDKAARRLIRKAFDAKHNSRVEQALKLPRAMKAQAREVASEERVEKIADHHNGNRSTKFTSTSGETRWARRLFASELAIHRPVYAPDQKTLRAMRTAKRKEKRAGKFDAIGQLVDRMAGEQK
jgi:hypothetical protein